MPNTDKILHFLAGAVIGFAAMELFGWIISVISVMAAAISKEIYDKYHPGHTVDVYDALATLAGGAFAFVISSAKYAY